MRPLRMVMFAITLLAASTWVASAQAGKAKGKGNKPTAGESASHPQPSRRATTDEIRIIRQYYTTNRMNAKPLPPGIAKNLARGKPLPPGIERTRVPDDLIIRLPSRPGYEWLVVGNRLVLLDRNRRIADILLDIF